MGAIGALKLKKKIVGAEFNLVCMLLFLQDPNAVAVCQFCGYISENKVQCESCKRKFTSATRYQIKGTGVQISFDDSGHKKRKMDKTCGSNVTVINKKAFYGKKIDEQNQLYSQIIQNANGNTLTVAISRNPRIITRGVARSRGRGRGRGRGVFVPGKDLHERHNY